MDQERYSLKELNQRVRDVIHAGIPEACWVVAEISEIKVNSSGHCYLELVEKSAEDDSLVARARGTIWAYVFRMLRPYFETSTGQVLREGLKVLVRAGVEFHELYGFSLNITDIDPSYTLGDLALQKAETLRRLEAEGVIGMNRELELPVVPQRIAVISSAQAAGYQDFMDQLHGNSNGYVFYTKLFPALMQGKEAEESIIRAFDKVFRHDAFFDVVVLIRGGGAQSDLACYNGYWLAYHITQFPLPVITGIGHDKDESVSDMVAHTPLKTPTAVAEFLIDRVSAFEEYLLLAGEKITDLSREMILGEKTRMERMARLFSPLVMQEIERRKQELAGAKLLSRSAAHTLLGNRRHQLSGWRSESAHRFRIVLQANKEGLNRHFWNLARDARQRLFHSKHRLDLFEKTVLLSDPQHILKKGFSISLHAGSVLRDASRLKKGDRVETRLFKGTFTSTVDTPTPVWKGKHPPKQAEKKNKQNQ